MKRLILPTITLAVGLLIGAGLGAAGKQTTTTVAQTETTSRTVTVASVDPTPAQVETAAATTPEPAATPTPAPKPKPAQRLHFAGNGGLTLKPFRLRHDATLKWTADGGYFGIYSSDGDIPVNSTGRHGQTFITAGVQRLQINATGNWTITIGES